MKLTKKDLVLLSHLRNDARLNLTKLSRMTGVPVSTIFDRLHHLKGGLITKHTTLVNFQALGFINRAHLAIKVRKDQREELKDVLASHHLVNTVYRINNGYDYLVEGVFRNARETEEFIQSLEERFEIADMHTYTIIEDIKREQFLTSPALLNLVMGEGWTG